MRRRKDKDGSTILEGDVITQVLQAFYPVGSILMSVDSANPNTRPGLGGTTWVAWGSGRAVVGVGGTGAYTSEQTFGANTVTLTAAQSGVNQHTHTENAGAPGYTGDISANHTHSMSILQKHATNTPNGNADNGGLSTLQGGTSGRWNSGQSGATNGASVGHRHVVGDVEYNAATGLQPPAVTSHENRQESIATYLWKRTA